MIGYYYKGQKTTRKFLEETFGVTKIRNKIKEARDKWGYDPYTDICWEDGVCFVNKCII